MHDTKIREWLLVFCTCPSQTIAEKIATQVISNSLAGCVNILPTLVSIYRWQGEIKKEQECLLLIKTNSSCYSKLEQEIKSLHPYDVPEVISISINNGSSEYLAWLRENLMF